MKHQVPVQLRFNDTDALGHVNNSTYFSFYDLGKSEYLPDLGKNPEIADIVKYALTASQLEWCVAAPDERSLHKYNECSYYLDTYHRSNCMQASTTYTLPYWMGVYHGIIER